MFQCMFSWQMKDCFNRGRWLIYFSSGWNIVDMLSILLFIIGAGLRTVALFNSTSDIWFDMARLALCVDFIIFTLRLLHNCYSNQVLGPTCSMIFKTVLVLMKFLYILAVIWISYAVASEAILYPNSVLNSYTMFFLLRKAYWQMFGQFFLEEIDAGKRT
uniref:Ion transport domain-containing protein n=1 Tax=Biomphalaria glabrata TaxID=6526 RepID=A0A2C9L8H6_BIOGL